MNINETLTEEFNIRPDRVQNIIKLIDDGNTIPFIARYRKEMTGSLDDQILREFFERLTYLRNMDAEREKILAVISEQGALTEEIENAVNNARTMTELEDIYRPFRPKRKTRASVAKQKGLQELANYIYEQSEKSDPYSVAEKYINEELGVNSAEDAINGAKDIIAEMVSDDANIRKRLRIVCFEHGIITSKGTSDDLGVYEMYGDFSERVKKIAGHRVLALNRGEKEKILKVGIDFDREKGLNIVYSSHLKGDNASCDLVKSAIDDSYDRLIFPSIEREIRNELTETASSAAIKVFSENLKQLLMQPPVKGKTAIGLDPGYRTGCKVAVVDETGKVLDTGVIYPAPPHNKIEEAKKKILGLIDKYNVEIIAIGNGTASHETEIFAADVIRETDKKVYYMVVSEAGASVYSASKLAAKEFPNFDVSLRSAVSIARRLQDPLAELIKIDPKSIGVGQYQHDMPQNQLSDALNGVVESCVNNVGVDLNTASAELLNQVAGVSKTVAENIVSFREENGKFVSRNQLKKVSKLGPKAFQQCAGFLRVTDGNNALDNTAVHPESYEATEKLLSLFNFSDDDIRNNKLSALSNLVKNADITEVSRKINVGVPTLTDIISEVSKPGRDPRDELPKPLLRTDVLGIESLKPGMKLKGTVRNVIDFGAFIDIGVHQDGLVHISQITNRFIKHPSEVLKVGDIVTVEIISVDIDKKRISLTMKI